ncbi:MAG: hypothetical protein HLUCCA08_05530 [Rhodobacteraceae bacterium HLUCCA08]|nr:MAG: hypothetical protein HLUCCA08_05530 [Rhodobacteraceae bacterium HLUCCA08]
MTMTETPDDKMLERLFAAARADAPVASDAFLAQVMADAAAMVPPAPVPAPRRRGPLAGFVSALAGGWAGLGGLAAATVAGLWIGMAAPDVLHRIAPGLYGDPVSVPFGIDQSAFLLEGDT